MDLFLEVTWGQNHIEVIKKPKTRVNLGRKVIRPSSTESPPVKKIIMAEKSPKHVPEWAVVLPMTLR